MGSRKNNVNRLKMLLLGSTILATSALVGFGSNAKAQAQEIIDASSSNPTFSQSTTNGAIIAHGTTATDTGNITAPRTVNITASISNTATTNPALTISANANPSPTHTLAVTVNANITGRSASGIHVKNAGLTTININSGHTVSVTTSGIHNGSANDQAGILIGDSSISSPIARTGLVTINNSGTISNAGTNATKAAIATTTSSGHNGRVIINNMTGGVITAGAASRFAIATGNGADSITISGGTVTGNINTDRIVSGATRADDRVEISAGTVTGDIRVGGASGFGGQTLVIGRDSSTVGVRNNATDFAGDSVLLSGTGRWTGGLSAGAALNGNRFINVSGTAQYTAASAANHIVLHGGDTTGISGSGNHGLVVRDSGKIYSHNQATNQRVYTGGSYYDRIWVFDNAQIKGALDLGIATSFGEHLTTIRSYRSNLIDNNSGIINHSELTYLDINANPDQLADSLNLRGGIVQSNITGRSGHFIIDVAGGKYSGHIDFSNSSDSNGVNAGASILFVRTHQKSAGNASALGTPGITTLFTGNESTTTGHGNYIYVSGHAHDAQAIVSGDINLGANHDTVSLAGHYTVDSEINLGAGRDAVWIFGAGKISGRGTVSRESSAGRFVDVDRENERIKAIFRGTIDGGDGDDTDQLRILVTDNQALEFSGRINNFESFLFDTDNTSNATITLTGAADTTQFDTGLIIVGNGIVNGTGRLTIINGSTNHAPIQTTRQAVRIKRSATLTLDGRFGTSLSSGRFGVLSVGAATDNTGTLNINDLIYVSGLEVHGGSTLGFSMGGSAVNGAQIFSIGRIDISNASTTNRIKINLTSRGGGLYTNGTHSLTLLEGQIAFSNTDANIYDLQNNTPFTASSTPLAYSNSNKNLQVTLSRNQNVHVHDIIGADNTTVSTALGAGTGYGVIVRGNSDDRALNTGRTLTLASNITTSQLNHASALALSPGLNPVNNARLQVNIGSDTPTDSLVYVVGKNSTNGWAHGIIVNDGYTTISVKARGRVQTTTTGAALSGTDFSTSTNHGKGSAIFINDGRNGSGDNTGPVTVENRGIISSLGESREDAVISAGSSVEEAMIITNHSTGNIHARGTTVTVNSMIVRMSGRSYAITTGAGDDQITNQGTISGNIYMGAGNDTLTFMSGTATGAISGGPGDDSLIFSGGNLSTNNIDLGAMNENNRLIFQGSNNSTITLTGTQLSTGNMVVGSAANSSGTLTITNSVPATTNGVAAASSVVPAIQVRGQNVLVHNASTLALNGAFGTNIGSGAFGTVTVGGASTAGTLGYDNKVHTAGLVFTRHGNLQVNLTSTDTDLAQIISASPVDLGDSSTSNKIDIVLNLSSGITSATEFTILSGGFSPGSQDNFNVSAVGYFTVTAIRSGTLYVTLTPDPRQTYVLPGSSTGMIPGSMAGVTVVGGSIPGGGVVLSLIDNITTNRSVDTNGMAISASGLILDASINPSTNTTLTVRVDNSKSIVGRMTGHGIEVNHGNTAIQVLATGSVQSSDSGSFQANTIMNTDQYGTGSAIRINDGNRQTSSGTVTITNAGIISAQGLAAGATTNVLNAVISVAHQLNVKEAVSINNSGMITARAANGYAITTGAGADTIEISGGTVTGHIALGASTDSNSQTFDASHNVTANAGDRVLISGGTLNGNISADAGASNQHVRISSGQLNGTIGLGNGHNSLVVTGGIARASTRAVASDTFYTGGDGTDQVRVAGGELTGQVLGGDNDDILRIFGSAGGTTVRSYVDLGVGNDTLTIDTHNGTVSFEGRINNVENFIFQGTSTATVTLQGAADSSQFKAGTSSWTVGANAGAGTLRIINGSTPSSGIIDARAQDVIVQNGATLRLDGAFGANTAATNFNTITIGNSTNGAGTLDINNTVRTANLTLAGGQSTLKVRLNPSNPTQTQVMTPMSTGEVILSGVSADSRITLDLNLSGGSVNGTTTFTIVTAGRGFVTASAGTPFTPNASTLLNVTNRTGLYLDSYVFTSTALQVTLSPQEFHNITTNPVGGNTIGPGTGHRGIIVRHTSSDTVLGRMATVSVSTSGIRTNGSGITSAHALVLSGNMNPTNISSLTIQVGTAAGGAAVSVAGRDTGHGIVVNDGNTTVQVLAAGHVHSSSDGTIRASDVTTANSYGTGSAIRINDGNDGDDTTGRVRIENSGTISALGVGANNTANVLNAVISVESQSDVDEAIDIINTGSIIARGTPNSGSAYAIATGAGDDTIEIRGGTVTGTVDTGTGADTVTISAGSINGIISTGTGDDIFNFTGANTSHPSITTAFDGGAGDDAFNFTAGTITGTITGGGDDDTLNFRGGSLNTSGINLGGQSGDKITFQGSGDSEITLTGTTNPSQFNTGSITVGSAATTKTLTITNANTTPVQVSGQNVTVHNGATLALRGGAFGTTSREGTASTFGTLRVGSSGNGGGTLSYNNTVRINTLTVQTGSTLRPILTSSTRLIAGTINLGSSDSKINVIPMFDTRPADGATFSILETTGANLTAAHTTDRITLVDSDSRDDLTYALSLSGKALILTAMVIPQGSIVNIHDSGTTNVTQAHCDGMFLRHMDGRALSASQIVHITARIKVTTMVNGDGLTLAQSLDPTMINTLTVRVSNDISGQGAGIVVNDGHTTVTVDAGRSVVSSASGTDTTGNGAGSAIRINDGMTAGGTNTAGVVTINNSGRLSAEGTKVAAITVAATTVNESIIINNEATGTITATGTGTRVAINLGMGDDAITTRGVIEGDINTGGGSDKVTIAGGVVTSNIDLGDGADTLTFSGETATLNVATADGTPSLNLGAGDEDSINFSGTSNAFLNLTGSTSHASQIAGVETISVGHTANSTGTFTITNGNTSATPPAVNPNGANVNIQNDATLNLVGNFGTSSGTDNFGHIVVGARGTLRYNGRIHLGSSNLTVQAGGTLSPVLSSNSSGSITTTGAVSFGSGRDQKANITPVFATDFAPVVGRSYAIVTASAGTDLTSQVSQLNVISSALVNYTLAAGTVENNTLVTTGSKNNVVLTVSGYNSASTIISDDPEAVAVIDSLTGSAATEAEVLAAIRVVASQGSDSMARAAEQISPSPNTPLVASTHIILSTQNQIDNRLASLYGGGEGIATGDGDIGQGDIWVKPYGFTTHQGRRSGLPGYEVDGWGVVGGFDLNIDEAVILGAGLGYDDSLFKSQDVGNTKTAVKAYTAFVTGSLDTGLVILDSQLGYGIINFAGTSVLNFGGLNRTRKSTYDGGQYFASGRMTLNDVLEGSACSMFPSVGLIYSRTDFDPYTETGAGSLNRRVNLDSVDALVGDVEVRLGFEQGLGQGGSLRPGLIFGANYDAITDMGVANSTFVGSTTPVRTQSAEPAAFGALLGFGLLYISPDKRHEIELEYSGNFKSGYDSHTVSAQYKLNF